MLTSVIKRTVKQETWLKNGDVSWIMHISGNVFNASNKKAGKNIHRETLKCLNRLKELTRFF